MKKAKFLYSYTNSQVGKICVFEYRGYEYEISYNTEWHPAELHRYEQEKIDELLERKEKEKLIEEKRKNMTEEERYKQTAEYGFNLFWNYIDS